MKHTLFFISIFNILLFGCMKSQIKNSRITIFQIYKPTTMIIFLNNLEDKNLAKFLQRELKKDLPISEFLIVLKLIIPSKINN